MRYPKTIVDQQGVYAAMFRERARKRIRSLVTDALIEEHRLDPVGQHSGDLEHVLHFFRQGRSSTGKHALLQEDPRVARYRIIRETGRPGKSVETEAEVFESYASALHAVFLARVADLRKYEG